MKKEITILLILLIIPLISAIEIQLSKDTYQPQETLQAEITGNFIDSLTIDNILLYKQDIPRSTPVISGLTKFQDIYYLYILLPNQEANFSIKIENTKYTEAGVEKTEDIVKEFEIKTTNQSALQINPGFIKTTEDSEDFSIKIKALSINQDISAELEATQETQDFSLAEDVEKTISFSISDIAAGKTDLKINDYTIPVFIIEKTEIQNDSQEQNESAVVNKTENQTKIDITNMTEEEIQSLSCSDIGEKCEDNEKCDGETKASLDGPCCTGTCTEKKKSNKWILGIVIIIIVAIVIWYFYSKSKKKQKLRKHKDILEEKSKKFEQRMGGEEISGGVGRS